MGVFHIMNEQELIWSAVLAWVGSKSIQFAKNIKWLPMDANTATLNKWVARAVALFTAIGIHSTFDPEAGTLMISGLSSWGIFQAIGEYAKQFMMQEIAYKKFVMEQPKP